MPQGGQVQLARGDREVFGAQVVEVLADVLRHDALERQAALLATSAGRSGAAGSGAGRGTRAWGWSDVLGHECVSFSE